jgi:biopolymer transport protein ExbB
MWEIIKAGGPVMWPIILCSIGAAAIVLERLWSLQQDRVLPRELTDKVWKLVETGQLTDKHVEALAQNSPLGRVLAAGLLNRHRGREIIKESIEDTGRHVAHDLERFLNILGDRSPPSRRCSACSARSPASSPRSTRSSRRASGIRACCPVGIGEALITTAAGLIVAIPALMGYRYLRGRIDALVIDMEKEALKLVQYLDSVRGEDPVLARERLRVAG